nr:hypothetical protein [Chloroflexia bacterium]
MVVGVYVDGFNFYYRVFHNDNRTKRVPNRYKWLDIVKMAQVLLPREDIAHVGYFTAPINRKRSEEQADRQRACLLALESLPAVEIVLGEFRWVNHMGTLKRNGSGDRERFWHWEEK